MKQKLFTIGIMIVVTSVYFHNAAAQSYTSTKVKPKYKSYTDSLKQVKYDYIFPIWGQKAYEKGFDIPYPVGIMANYIWMQQGILIDNMQLGLTTDNKDIPLTDVGFIKFGDNTNTSYTANVRPDVWLFPFLNVYGIFGYGKSNTEVKIIDPVELKSIVEQNISTAGFGIMTAFGLGNYWVSCDYNWTWNKPELLDKPVRVNVLGVRLGRTFSFKNNPERNFAFWVGGMRASMSSSTNGAVTLQDALPQETWDRKEQIVDDYYAWYNSLDPNKPIDKVKIDKADQVLTPIIERIDQLDGGATVKYGMDKQVKELWNGLFGVQFQYNKHLMFRSEAGLIGDRKSILASVNYRFLL